MAKENAEPVAWAECLSAAACGGWWALLVGVLIQCFFGLAFLFIVHTPLHDAVAALWGVGPKAVTIVMIVFSGVFKLCLTLWLLVCVFLTVWARRLRRAAG